MACVFGEMRTLKTSERAAAVSPKSVLFGEKEYLWKKREEITQPRHCIAHAFRGRVGMKSLPRYARAPRSG